MTATHFAALFGTMFLLSVVPGPSDFAVVTRSAASGFTHGLIMIAGIISADFLFIILAMYSLAAAADVMGESFVWIQYLCGAYLIWMGVGAMRSQPQMLTGDAPPEYSRASSFMGGLLITLGDPKAILFYMGLLPAYVNLAEAGFRDALLIMLAATAAIVLAKTGYAYLAERAGRFFQNTVARKRLDRLAGVVLLGTGVFLIMYRA